MSSTAIPITLDFTLAESLNISQRWILSAMKEYGPGLVTMLWRIVGNEQDVCDVYQDVFVSLVASESCKPDNIRAYLFRTASNLAINILRRRKLFKQAHQVLSHQQQTAATVDPYGYMDTSALKQHLREALQQLPEPYQEIICLHDLAELPYPEVARILGLSGSAVRVYRHRAIKLLAARMNKNEQERQL